MTDGPDQIDAWPALADLMTGSTLLLAILGLASLSLIPEGDAPDDLISAGRSYEELTKRRPDLALEPSLRSLTESGLEPRMDRLAGAETRVKELTTEVDELKSMGAVSEQVARAIRDELPKSLRPTIKNGRIRLNADLLFGNNELTVKDPGRLRTIDQLGRGILTVLSRDNVSQHVRFVTIQGHGSAQGSVEANLRTSALRALFLVRRWRSRFPQYFPNRGVVAAEACVGAKIFFGGFGESRPIPGTESEARWDINRRIEIEIVPKQASDQSDLPRCP